MSCSQVLLWRARECREPIPVPDITVAQSLCKLVQALFTTPKIKLDGPAEV